MEKNKKNIRTAKVGIILIVLMVAIVTITFSSTTKTSRINNLEDNVGLLNSTVEKLLEENTFLKKIYKYETEWFEIDMYSEASDYYDEAGYYYDVSNYRLLNQRCGTAKDLLNEHEVELRGLNSKVKEEDSELFRVFSQMLEKEMEYSFALYESCEYLESAGNCYDVGDYSCGDLNIEGHNERITDHDNAIDDFNDLRSQYNYLKKGLLAE